MNIILYVVIIMSLSYNCYTKFKPAYVPLLLLFIISAICTLFSDALITANIRSMLLVVQIILLIVTLVLHLIYKKQVNKSISK